MFVKESHDILVAQESDKMIEEDKIIKEAKKGVKNKKVSNKNGLFQGRYKLLI